MKQITYKYTDDDGDPVRKCPECGHSWGPDGGVIINLSVDGHTVEVPSHIDSNGILLDTDDDAVANGYHAGTECGNCCEDLTNMVNETRV